MKIKSIKLKDFKRFTDLTIEGLPETAKLVVMVGPNGSGKSSVLEAPQYLRVAKGFSVHSGSPDYYLKSVDLQNDNNFSVVTNNIKIEFHERVLKGQNDWLSAFHIRSPYRNDSVGSNKATLNPPPIKTERKFARMTENDQAVMANYSRLFSQLMERCSATVPDQRNKNIGDLQDEVFGELRDAIQELFRDPDLILTGLGSPANQKIFQFNKGSSEFSFENLASGEKAALDMLLDIIVFKAECNDTVFGIDEPEAHIHTKLQGPLLEKLYNLIPDTSQLWIATHSIGMVRKAQDLWHGDPDSVVFLDFGKDDTGQDRNFDKQVTIRPAKPNPNLWAQTYEVALGDLSELVASEQYVFCEGEDFDEACYQNIFGSHHPETRFISIGGRNNVEKTVTALKGKIAKGAKVIGVVDRDDATEGEMEIDDTKGVRTLSRKSIESYLLDDEVLRKLCEKHGKQDKEQDLLTAKTEALKKRTTSPDDLKPIAQDLHNAAKGIIDSVPLGNKKESFMRDILAPLIQPGMKVYAELHKDIFGD